MAFIVMFMVLMLLVPVIADIQRHGRDNILRRSAADLVQLRPVRATVDFFGFAANTVRAAVILPALVLLLVYLLAWLLDAMLR